MCGWLEASVCVCAIERERERERGKESALAEGARKRGPIVFASAASFVNN